MKNNLLKELTLRIKNAKKEETNEDVIKRDFVGFLIKSREQTGEKVRHFYFTDKQYYDVLALHKFLRAHPNVTLDEVKGILRVKKFQLDFLRRLLSMFPNLLNELYFGGPMHVEIMYAKEQKRIDDLHKEREEYRRKMRWQERFKYKL